MYDVGDIIKWPNQRTHMVGRVGCVGAFGCLVISIFTYVLSRVKKFKIPCLTETENFQQSNDVQMKWIRLSKKGVQDYAILTRFEDSLIHSLIKSSSVFESSLLIKMVVEFQESLSTVRRGVINPLYADLIHSISTQWLLWFVKFPLQWIFHSNGSVIAYASASNDIIGVGIFHSQQVALEMGFCGPSHPPNFST